MIGVFDSGVGGLSVWQELVKLLPCEEYVYVSDSGYCPYGPKPKEYIVERAKRITEFFIDKGADIVVVACNTATAAAIEVLRSSFDIPFVGMEPAVKPAALQSESGVIGVLATKGTLKGELYLKTLHKFASNTKVIEQVGTGLVELVEQGKTETDEAITLLRQYISPMIESGADHIVLGCTHYPFLTNSIRSIAGETVKIVNPAPAIARQAMHLLSEVQNSNVDKIPGWSFYTTGDNLDILKIMVENITDEMVESGIILSKSTILERQFCTVDI